MLKFSCSLSSLAAAVVVAVAMVQPAVAATKAVSSASTSALSGAIKSNVPTATSTVVTFDVSGIFSNEPLGNALNEVFPIAVGANSTVVGVGWDVTLFADSPSWLSEMVVGMGSSSQGFLNLTPGVGDDFSGTATYSSGGIVDLVGLNLSFQVGPDGVLRLEFFEAFNDFAGDWDGKWESGTLSFAIAQVPEPSTYGLMALGLLGVGAMVRRRR